MSPVSTKIQQTRQRLAALEGEHLPVFEETALQAIPVQVGGLHPITDLWYIERSIDTPKSCDSTSLTWWKKLPLSSAPPERSRGFKVVWATRTGSQQKIANFLRQPCT